MKTFDNSVMWLRYSMICVLLLLAGPAVSAERPQASGRFVDQTFRDVNGEYKYVVFVPAGYQSDKASPAILWLHGAGERGTDNRLQLTVGLAPFIQARAKTFPFLVVFPQCELTEGRVLDSWNADNPDGKRAISALDDARKHYNFDPNRVVLTGWSMGGFGAWNLGMSLPSRWSAIVPVSGGGDIDRIGELKEVPVWAFHGELDTVVKSDRDLRMVDSLNAAGGVATFTKLSNGVHDINAAVYGNDAVIEWMLNPEKSPSQLGDVTVTPAEVVKVPFVPAVEISQAVGLRLGNEVLNALSYSIPSTTSPDLLSGRINDMFSSTVASGRQFSIQFSGISYHGELERIVTKGHGKDRILVQLGIRNISLAIGGTFVSGVRHSAQAGPILISIGQRYPVWFNLELGPYIADRQIRLRLISAGFQIPDDNWSVSQPAGVSVQGFGMTEDAVVSGLMNGLYGAKGRIENEIVAIAPRVVQEIEKRISIPDAESTMSEVWQLPFYSPRLQAWPEQISADENGLSLLMGLTVASIDPFGPAKVLKRFKPADVSLAQLPADKVMHVIFAPQILGPLTEMFVESDQARLDVSDIPEPLFRKLAERDALQEIIPDLAQYSDALQIRSTLSVVLPLAIVAPEHDVTSEGSKPVEFHLPDVRVVISIKKDADQINWLPCAIFDMDLSERLEAGLQKPNHAQRIVELAWLPAANATGTGKFAEGYDALDTSLQTDRYVEQFNVAWASYFAGLREASATVPDVSVGLSKLRLSGMQCNPSFVDLKYSLARIELSNLTNESISYQTKAPTSAWGNPLTLTAGASHEFEIPYPLTYRRNVPSGSEVYTLPVGSHSEFRVPLTGGAPRLFSARRP